MSIARVGLFDSLTYYPRKFILQPLQSIASFLLQVYKTTFIYKLYAAVRWYSKDKYLDDRLITGRVLMYGARNKRDKRPLPWPFTRKRYWYICIRTTVPRMRYDWDLAKPIEYATKERIIALRVRRPEDIRPLLSTHTDQDDCKVSVVARNSHRWLNEKRNWDDYWCFWFHGWEPEKGQRLEIWDMQHSWQNKIHRPDTEYTTKLRDLHKEMQMAFGDPNLGEDWF